MKIIIPMAGQGYRLRPHTLTIPKSLIPIVGKPIIQRLVENIVKIINTPLEEIVFIIDNFVREVDIKNLLLKIAKNIGIKCSILKQEKPLGTAHALLCAHHILNGPIIIAYADTLFTTKLNLQIQADGLILTKEVKNPYLYGIAKCNHEGYIIDFIEKPKKFISNLAIIGIYYIKDANFLKKELQYLVYHNIQNNGEYQLTDVLENLKQKGLKFLSQKVDNWMDCGNKNNIINTNSKILDIENKKERLINSNASIKNSLIIEPCFIGAHSIIENSKIGPYVSIGKNTIVKNSNIEKSLIQNFTNIKNANLLNSMIGNHISYIGGSREINLGDYSSFEFSK